MRVSCIDQWRIININKSTLLRSLKWRLVAALPADGGSLVMTYDTRSYSPLLFRILKKVYTAAHNVLPVLLLTRSEVQFLDYFIVRNSHTTVVQYTQSRCVQQCVCVCVCFLPIHSGHQIRWTYQPGSHRRNVTRDFSSFFFQRCVP